MDKSRKWFLVLGALVVAGLILAACAPQTVVETVVVTEKVVETVEVPAEAPAQPPTTEGECCDTYRMGIFEEPLTTNYWNYLGPGSSVWTAYALADTQAASLFGLSNQRFDWVPVLAAELPGEPVQEGDFWTITVTMLQGATWSDGTPITAHDVVFTLQTCLDLKLTANWQNACKPEVLDHVEAVDDYTVKFFFTDKPGLAQWQFGVSQAPILPKHVWEDVVNEARAFVEGVTEPEVARPADCEAEDLSEEDKAACDAWAAYDEAFENARKTLYEAEPPAMVSPGAFTFAQYEPGAFVRKDANDAYFFKGSKSINYANGAWKRVLPDGSEYAAYGDPTGDVELEVEEGPFTPNVIMSVYGSQDAAFLALRDGEIDFVINPLGLSRGLREQAEQGEGVRTIVNEDNGLFYLAFNMRKEPFNMPEFRQAVEVLIDKEFVAESVLQGTVFPAYSVVPSGNKFWHNPDIPRPYVGMSREERINKVIEILEGAGWTWEKKPAWNADRQDVDPGEGLRMPNGQPVPEITILGPGPAYDPVRATFNQWISEWMREAGIPAQSELTGFNTILTPVFVEANFDMYILGWGLTIYPDYLCDFFHSKNDTATTGNFNTPGYSNPEFDAKCDEFVAETDIKRAQELARELQLMLAQDLPYIPLFYRPAIDLIRDNIVLPYEQVLGGIADQVGFESSAKPLIKTTR